MKKLSVEYKKFPDLKAGDIFRFACNENKGYACKVDDENVVILSGSNSSGHINAIGLLGGRPVLKIENELFFEPDLSDDSIKCPEFPKVGDVVVTNHGLFLRLRGDQIKYFDLNKRSLHLPTTTPSLDDSIVIRHWAFKADLETEAREIFSSKNT